MEQFTLLSAVHANSPVHPFWRTALTIGIARVQVNMLYSEVSIY